MALSRDRAFFSSSSLVTTTKSPSKSRTVGVLTRHSTLVAASQQEGDSERSWPELTKREASSPRSRIKKEDLEARY